MMRRNFAALSLSALLALPAFAQTTPTQFFSMPNYEGTAVSPAVSQCPNTGNANCFTPATPITFKSLKLSTFHLSSKGGGTGDNPISLYEFPNYQGRCTTYNDGQFPMLQTGAGSFKDHEYCPPQVQLYGAANYSGVSAVFTGSIPWLGGYNFNDMASSLRLINGAQRVALYADANFAGACTDFAIDQPVLIASMSGVIMDKKASSLIVDGHCPTTYTVTIHSNGAYSIDYIVDTESGRMLSGTTKTWTFTHAINAYDPPRKVQITPVSADNSAHMLVNASVTQSINITTYGTIMNQEGQYTCSPQSACP
jgi:hypothetical protein